MKAFEVPDCGFEDVYFEATSSPVPDTDAYPEQGLELFPFVIFNQEFPSTVDLDATDDSIFGLWDISITYCKEADCDEFSEETLVRLKIEREDSY